jgi:hypothetical protein
MSSKKILQIGGNTNSQKMVFSMLVAILLLEFGSLTKLQKLWQLAFNATTPATATATNAPVKSVNVSPTHQNVGMPV